MSPRQISQDPDICLCGFSADEVCPRDCAACAANGRVCSPAWIAEMSAITETPVEARRRVRWQNAPRPPRP